ncbi:hypothetical protein AAG570_006247 [Ranatra chinensis]|uniref:Uncharacterized protein n=1 Tax=Ranatra chinensis TaxID=642074 RepID=A0ABD0YTI1_9HEMI
MAPPLCLNLLLNTFSLDERSRLRSTLTDTVDEIRAYKALQILAHKDERVNHLESKVRWLESLADDHPPQTPSQAAKTEPVGAEGAKVLRGHSSPLDKLANLFLKGRHFSNRPPETDLSHRIKYESRIWEALEDLLGFQNQFDDCR